ncbi:MAG: hypothetical protein FRX49_04252 [Trebouxia sp. A1-2]|nr:MAG: hypothetical protein FRX49_04252 [Trebouxia sp. A1-2]
MTFDLEDPSVVQSGASLWEQDCVPTTACTFSFRGVESSGTYAYYLTSAFKQVYVPPERTWAVTGLCGGRYFMKKLLDKLQVRPQLFAREEYKECYSQHTGSKFSKPEAEAAEAYLQGWLHQIVSHIAADRSLHYNKVAAAVDVAPWSAAEVVAQGLLTASRYRSQACSHITPDSPPHYEHVQMIGSNRCQAARDTQVKGAVKQRIQQAQLLRIVSYAAGKIHTGNRQLADAQIASNVDVQQRPSPSVKVMSVRRSGKPMHLCKAEISALDTDEQKRKRLSSQIGIDLQFQCGYLNTLINASVVDQQIHSRVQVCNFFSSSLTAGVLASVKQPYM